VIDLWVLTLSSGNVVQSSDLGLVVLFLAC
jgi:hypothetical protein